MSQQGISGINLNITNSWRGALSVAFQKLRRLAFIFEEAFQWGDFDPQINWQGMTVTVPVIRRARYLKIYKFFWYSLDFEATLAAPLTNNILVKIPASAPNDPDLANFTPRQVNIAVINPATNEIGHCFLSSGKDTIEIRRPLDVNFTAVLTRIRSQGFFEVQL